MAARPRPRPGAGAARPSAPSGPGRPAPTAPRPPSGRAVALEALRRIDEGAYANLVVPALLGRSRLEERDRAFATELAYGTTRMRRACDWLVERFLFRDVDPGLRAALRLGAYQLVFLGTAPHAAVGETVALVQGPGRGLVNAVLRKVADAGPPAWPDEATRLSCPDWILDRLAADLGRAAATAALEGMNRPAPVTVRADGYVQDPSSQEVAALVGVEPGDRVAELCAAPGGKATLMARRAPEVVAAGDVNPGRLAVLAGNARRLGLAGVVAPVAGDGRRPPLRPAAFDHVLVDAPCSGLGVLRRRPDARWRIREADVDDLAALQRGLLDAAVTLLRPGGRLTYSVCTLTAAETSDVDGWLASTHPALVADLPPPGPASPWHPHARGWRILPQDAGTDGMFVLRLRRPPAGAGPGPG